MRLSLEMSQKTLQRNSQSGLQSSDLQSGYALLYRFIESEHFSLFLCVSYLERYADNIGIHFHLCQKLRTYPNAEIEFFLPQLVQLQVTVESESLALEDLLIDLCTESVHCTLLTFWQLQAHLNELSSQPESYGFQVSRRLFNKLQYLLFNVGEPPSKKIRENTLPALVLSSALAGVIGLPQIANATKPLAASQGRRLRTHIFQIASKLPLNRKPVSDSTEDLQFVDADDVRRHNNLGLDWKARAKPMIQTSRSQSAFHSKKAPYGHLHETYSLPDLPVKHESSPRNSLRKHSASSNMSYAAKVTALKTNYFRCETQFMYALQAISTRLLQVPKQARLSALRAEIAMLNRDLPAEVDIPLLLPTNSKGPNAKLNKVVRISPAEATVLNSAERVPFLLLIEYLKEEIDFNPSTEANKAILDSDLDRRYIFDITYSEDGSLTNNGSNSEDNLLSIATTNEEEDMGEMTVISLEEEKSESFLPESLFNPSSPRSIYAAINNPNGSSSPRASDLSFASSYNIPQQPLIDVTDVATHMRTAAIMLTQLDSASGSKLSKDEILAIKAKIIASMQSMEEHTVYTSAVGVMNGSAGERRLENDMKTAGGGAANDDPSATNLGEEWFARKERIRRSSPHGHLPNWDVFSVIAKTGSDLRQEAFACQLIQAIQNIWLKSHSGVWVKKMRILITSDTSGLVETITNGLSVHSIKKKLTNLSVASGDNPRGTIASLCEHFEKTFGEPGSKPANRAVESFVRSLAAYSLICYILQIKDRHNGNILLDNEGHIIHIDFGFLLSNSPGSFGFEAAPFKLTQEYIELMGGVDSKFFELFKSLMKSAFKSLRKEAESVMILVEMMQRDSNLPCFALGPATTQQLRQRFQLHLSEAEVDQFVETVLIQKSMGSIYTR